jgi:hypothetical protein
VTVFSVQPEMHGYRSIYEMHSRFKQKYEKFERPSVNKNFCQISDTKTICQVHMACNRAVRQAFPRIIPLNLPTFPHAYRQGTAVQLRRSTGGSGRSSSCGQRLALTDGFGSERHTYIGHLDVGRGVGDK